MVCHVRAHKQLCVQQNLEAQAPKQADRKLKKYTIKLKTLFNYGE
jgi:hypothetical protein